MNRLFFCQMSTAFFSMCISCAQAETPPIEIPKMWNYSKPLISPETRKIEPSKAQKDPTVVYYDNKWHVFMTVKLPNRSAIEYCAFDKWEQANDAPRTLLNICDSDYFCAPQIFYLTPHKKWYLVYQAGMPGAKKMWVAFSTSENINDPGAWTKAAPMLDGGPNDPRTVGGLDYWIICTKDTAWLFYTSLNGKMWRMSTPIAEFPQGFSDCQLALQGDFFEASHTYKITGQEKFLTLLEQKGKRYFQAYIADRIDGEWNPLAVTFAEPFAGAKNIQSEPGTEQWTDNISHGELIRSGYDEKLEVSPKNLQFLFQGMLETDKKQKYGSYRWRIGMLTPAD